MQHTRSNLVRTDKRTTRDARPAISDATHPFFADDRRSGRPTNSFRLAAIG